MTGTVRIGCSGWSYVGWRGPVYPEALPPSAWFAWYARHLTTVELNSTFYRLPTADTVRTWAGAAPPGFVYAVKMGGFGSHRKKLLDAESWLPRHVERAALLGASRGPTLVQLPPHWRCDPQRLDAFLGTARDVAPRTWRWAVELRDPSWVHEEVLAVLRQHDAALCIHDLLADHPWELTSDWTYMRFHGPDAITRPYTGPYGRRRLREAAAWMADRASEGADVHAYFNNDVGGHAFHDARLLVDLIGATTSPRLTQ